MKPTAFFPVIGFAALAALGYAALGVGQAAIPGIKTTAKNPYGVKVTMTDAQWKSKLSPKAYHILREEGTEAPYASKLNDVHTPGTFVSAATGQPLFRTADKFDSGTGWPSFVKPISKDAVWYRLDNSLGMPRIEVLSTKDNGHLGHLFNDGPKARGGLRYCMNGDAMKFVPDKK